MRGQFPKYVPPQAKASRIDQSLTNLRDSVASIEQLPKRNFIADNIKRSTTMKREGMISPALRRTHSPSSSPENRE